MKTSKKSNEHFIVPFISDYGFKVTFARNSIFSRKAVQLLIDTNTIIKKLKMLRNEFEGMVEDARAGVYDVLCEDEIKRIFIIEMQRGNYDNLFERLQFYAYQIYNTLVQKGKHGFSSLRPIYCICVIEDKIINDDTYCRVLNLRDENNNLIGKNIEFRLIELGKVPIKQANFDQVTTDKEKLLYTMKYAHRINPKEANQIPPFFSEEWLAEAVKKLDTSKMSPDQLAMYHITMVRARTILDYEEKKRNEDRQKMRQEVKEEVKQEVKEEVKQEVKEEVKQEVLMEEQAKTIINLYKKGVSIDFIADVMGLSSNQIETIINTLNL